MLLANWLMGLCRNGLRRRGGKVGRRIGSVQRKRDWSSRWLGSVVEPLETRSMFSQAALTAGSLFVTSTGTANDRITVSRNESMIRLNDPNNTITAGAGITVIDTHTVELSAASLSGSFNVNLGDGTDTLTFADGGTFTAVGGFDLAAEEITVGANATLSTRATSDDLVTGNSTANSGNVLMRGRAITVSSGARILAQAVNSGTSFTSGDITLAASATDVRSYFSSLTENQTASVTLAGSSSLRGDDISITADSRDVTGNTVPDLVQDFLGPVRDLIQKATKKNLPTLDGFSAVVNLRGADAFVTVTDTTIVASGRVGITASALADSQLDAQAVSSRIGTDSTNVNLGVAVGYSQAKGTATADILGTTTITAAGNVLISTEANVVAEARAKTQANLGRTGDNADSGANAFALAITNADLTSKANVGQGVSVTSTAGNVNVLANGEVVSKPEAQAGSFHDGMSGVTVGLGFDESEVKATVDGTLTAKGTDPVLRFNPASVVFTNGDTLTISNHGLKQGQRFVYTNGGGESIGGLTDGETYVVNVVNANTVQFARERAVALNAAQTNATATQSVAGLDLKTFDAAANGAVDADNDRMTIANHGFANGQKIIYTAIGSQPILGLRPSSEYLVANVSGNSFQLQSPLTGPLTGGVINLRFEQDQSGNSVRPTGEHGFLFEKARKTFSPQMAVNDTRGTLTLASHGFQTGDAIVYRTDSTKTSVQFPKYHGVPLPTLVRDTPIGGLKDGDIYYVSVVDTNTIRLARSVAGAKAATAVDLTSVGSLTNHGLDFGLTHGIGVQAHLTAENRVNAGSAVGATPPQTEAQSSDAVASDTNDAKKLTEFDPMDTAPADSGSTADDTKQSGSKFKLSVAGGVGLNYVDHDVAATIGSHAILKSEADISVLASIRNDVQLIVEAELTKSKKDSDEQGNGQTPTEINVAAGVALGFYTNSAKATVAGGARVDARDTLTVDAKVEYPFLAAPDGEINAAQLFTDNRPSLRDIFTGKLNFSSDVLNTWVLTKSDSETATVGLAGAVSISIYDNTAEARVGNDARINQDTSTLYRDGSQKVEVTALTDVQLIDMTGLGEIEFTKDQGPSVSQR